MGGSAGLTGKEGKHVTGRLLRNLFHVAARDTHSLTIFFTLLIKVRFLHRKQGQFAKKV
jgi:hypothetical protein